MPVWHDPPEVALKTAIDSAWRAVADEIEDDPPFEEVTGIPIEDLTKHATETVAGLMKSKNFQHEPAAYVQLYCMGFVVGMKYGEQKEQKRQEEQ